MIQSATEFLWFVKLLLLLACTLYRIQMTSTALENNFWSSYKALTSHSYFSILQVTLQDVRKRTQQFHPNTFWLQLPSGATNFETLAVGVRVNFLRSYVTL
ncbi:uncharacterized protein BKA78DRAFT_98683 [Phyllosticta capitalensis]|uniref:uncharacterized protein n=1 Tax=Phyllosticta capitalensis TaxID=121624 RepID=UPI003131F0F1